MIKKSGYPKEQRLTRHLGYVRHSKWNKHSIDKINFRLDIIRELGGWKMAEWMLP